MSLQLPCRHLWPPLVLGILSGDMILGLWVGNGLTDGSSPRERVKPPWPHDLDHTQRSFLLHLSPHPQLPPFCPTWGLAMSSPPRSLYPKAACPSRACHLSPPGSEVGTTLGRLRDLVRSPGGWWCWRKGVRAPEFGRGILPAPWEGRLLAICSAPGNHPGARCPKPPPSFPFLHPEEPACASGFHGNGA